jgi:multidrug resistance efflux pump
MLDELGPGGCVGWNAALAAVPGVCAVATAEVNGLLVPAPAFLEITRYDAAIKAAIYSKPLKSEVWRAVLAEMERRTGTMRSARSIVDTLLKDTLVRDWPDEEAQIRQETEHVWVAVGGEGVQHGERWSGGEGVLWARLVGLPEFKLNEGLIAVNALATIEAEVSPSRSDVNLPLSGEKGASVSSSEVRRPSPEPSRSSVGRIEESALRADRAWTRVLAAFLVVALCTLGGIAWWASRQEVIRTISLPGRLTFSGETRPLLASATGTLSELNARAGERVQPGAILAVIRPPFDEAKWAALNASQASAKAEAEFCDAFLAGTTASTAGLSGRILDLVRDYARINGEVRVLNAISKGDPGAPGLTQEERQRVQSHLANVSDARSERLDSAARDASTRDEDLREAESALREAQEEVRSHQQSFAGVTSEDKKEAAQEVADYRRVLGVLNREVNRRQEAVNRLRREINLLRAEAVPVAVPPADDRSAQLATAQAGLARIELEIRQRGHAARQLMRETQDATERFRLEVAPRQILARAPGLVLEVSSLAIGAEVHPDTALAQLVTREMWQIECSIPPAQMARLHAGQPVRVAYIDGRRKPASAIEPLVMTDGTNPRLRLHVTRDDWRDGMHVQIETDVVVGSLLDEWLGRIPLVP